MVLLLRGGGGIITIPTLHSPYIGLIYGRYLHSRIREFPLKHGKTSIPSMSFPARFSQPSHRKRTPFCGRHFGDDSDTFTFSICILQNCIGIKGNYMPSRNHARIDALCPKIKQWTAYNWQATNIHQIQGLVNVLIEHWTSPYYWGYNIQQIFVLVMWKENHQKGTYLPTPEIITIYSYPPYSECFTTSPMRCSRLWILWILWLIQPPGRSAACTYF